MRTFRLLLLPLSWIYGLILGLRHFLYDRGVFKSYTSKIRTIAIGNLSFGGTGKTPLIDYLADQLDPNKSVIISRGYGRKTRGTILVEKTMSAEEVGDEPLLLKKRNPEINVVVDEDRTRAIQFIEKKELPTETILFDDALQHRKINPHLSILLTTWQSPFCNDHLFPAGNLRDIKSRKQDADVLIVTKTPRTAGKEEKFALKERLGLSSGQELFFAGIKYQSVHELATDNEIEISDRVVLLSAIANADLFERQAKEKTMVLKHFKYRDHHLFKESELQALSDFIDTFEGLKPLVLTTEKDAQRLLAYSDFFKERQIRVGYWKIKIDFGSEKERFNSLIQNG